MENTNKKLDEQDAFSALTEGTYGIYAGSDRDDDNYDEDLDDENDDDDDLDSEDLDDDDGDVKSDWGDIDPQSSGPIPSSNDPSGPGSAV